MTHLRYITHHLLLSWVNSWTYNFKIWADLMTNNYEPYVNPYAESSAQECYEWFWAAISMDDTYSKDFLESLYEMMDDIDTGAVITVPAKDVLKVLKQRVNKENDNELSH